MYSRELKMFLLKWIPSKSQHIIIMISRGRTLLKGELKFQSCIMGVWGVCFPGKFWNWGHQRCHLQHFDWLAQGSFYTFLFFDSAKGGMASLPPLIHPLISLRNVCRSFCQKVISYFDSKVPLVHVLFYNLVLSWNLHFISI